jgi:hypothetical protein
MIARPIFFEDSDLIVNKLRLLYGKGVNSGTPGTIKILCLSIFFSRITIPISLSRQQYEYPIKSARNMQESYVNAIFVRIFLAT